MTTYTADLVFPADQAPIPNGYVTFDDSGKVSDVGSVLPKGVKAQAYKGALVAGFVNTHCHLELSHMIGRVDTGTGLLPFLKGVVSLRQVDPADIAKAIEDADKYMWEAGIQAVGDISNTADTAKVKTSSKITYFTFVEAFDFLQGGAMAKEVFAKAEATYKAQPEPKRYVPHAPYTVSPALYAMINDANPSGGTVSIHNQETPAENEFFESKSGGFIDFYRDFGFNIEHVSASAKTSLATTLPHLNPANRVLFVHNTLTTKEDMQLAQSWSDKVYWATCPNANLYIENRLPRYADFMEQGARMTIGTDSLTSNWQLCVLEEMKTIQRMQRYVDTPTLIQWATLNGAEALGLADELGSLTVGKRPGLVLLEDFDEAGRFTPSTKAKRLV